MVSFANDYINSSFTEATEHWQSMVQHASNSFYRASACNACRSRYCFTVSVCLSNQCRIVSKGIDTSSHSFDIQTGHCWSLF